MRKTRKDFALSPEERADARQAIRMLEGSGLSMSDAARIALHLNPGASECVDVAVGIDRYILACVRKQMATGTLEFYQNHLEQVAATWGAMKMDSVRRADLRKWLESLELAPDTIRGRLRAIRAMWRWCMREDPPLANMDPTDGLQLDLPVTRTQDRFLTPEETAKVMNGAGIYTATLACVFFAGIRIEEVRAKKNRKPPMLWKHIDFKEQHIRVESEKNSNATGRIQEGLPENLWAWLRHGKRLLEQAGHPVGPDDPVCPFEVKQAWQVARKTLGYWPKNAHRHSFITYHIARYKDTGKTSELIGHQGRVQLLHSRYKGRATEQQARGYFAIAPDCAAPAFFCLTRK